MSYTDTSSSKIFKWRRYDINHNQDGAEHSVNIDFCAENIKGLKPIVNYLKRESVKLGIKKMKDFQSQ